MQLVKLKQDITTDEGDLVAAGTVGSVLRQEPNGDLAVAFPNINTWVGEEEIELEFV